METKFEVVLAADRNTVGPKIGYWDVLRLDCAAGEAVDVDGDDNVDIVQSGAHGGSVILADAKYRNTALQLFKNEDIYEGPLTAEELNSVQKKFDRGIALARKRLGELEAAVRLKGTLLNPERKGHLQYRAETELMIYSIGGVSRFSSSWDKMCQQNAMGKPVTKLRSVDRDLSLTISDPALLQKLEPQLQQAADHICGE